MHVCMYRYSKWKLWMPFPAFESFSVIQLFNFECKALGRSKHIHFLYQNLNQPLNSSSVRPKLKWKGALSEVAAKVYAKWCYALLRGSTYILWMMFFQWRNERRVDIEQIIDAVSHHFPCRTRFYDSSIQLFPFWYLSAEGPNSGWNFTRQQWAYFIRHSSRVSKLLFPFDHKAKTSHLTLPALHTGIRENVPERGQYSSR